MKFFDGQGKVDFVGKKLWTDSGQTVEAGGGQTDTVQRTDRQTRRGEQTDRHCAAGRQTRRGSRPDTARRPNIQSTLGAD